MSSEATCFVKATKRHDLPLEVLRLVCQQSDQAALQKLRQTSALWRYLSLPLLWQRIEINDWEHVSNAQAIHATYGKFVRTIELCRNRRRRGNSHTTPASTPVLPADSQTKTQVLCEWLGLRWEALRRVTVGAWPPYNFYRVQETIATSCPRLEVLVLEGAAAAWVDTLQRAIATHPRLVGLHITEDTRALLPPAADGPLAKAHSRFRFLECGGGSQLTSLTVPCLADSVIQLLGSLPTLLPMLKSLDLRQVDSGIAAQLHVSIPPRLTHLKIQGQHPLNARMLDCHHGRYTNASMVPVNDKRRPGGLRLCELALQLTALVVTGTRGEEAAWSEYKQFWSILFQNKLLSLSKLVIPAARQELGLHISQSCPVLQYLRFMRAGSAIYPEQNYRWVAHLTQLACLRHLDIASSNNEYEGCSLLSELVTKVSWNTPWLHTLYLSRIRLSTQTLGTLLRMVPCLHTLWFTFDASLGHSPNTNIPTTSLLTTTVHLRYLIIYAILNDQSAPACSTRALVACLCQLPTLKRCRLPMFTYPDDQRHWLRSRFPQIDFTKYAPPY